MGKEDENKAAAQADADQRIKMIMMMNDKNDEVLIQSCLTVWGNFVHERQAHKMNSDKVLGLMINESNNAAVSFCFTEWVKRHDQIQQNKKSKESAHKMVGIMSTDKENA